MLSQLFLLEETESVAEGKVKLVVAITMVMAVTMVGVLAVAAEAVGARMTMGRNSKSVGSSVVKCIPLGSVPRHWMFD